MTIGVRCDFPNCRKFDPDGETFWSLSKHVHTDEVCTPESYHFCTDDHLAGFALNRAAEVRDDRRPRR